MKIFLFVATILLCFSCGSSKSPELQRLEAREKILKLNTELTALKIDLEKEQLNRQQLLTEAESRNSTALDRTDNFSSASDASASAKQARKARRALKKAQKANKQLASANKRIEKIERQIQRKQKSIDKFNKKIEFIENK